MNSTLRMYERSARVYRGVWRGSVFSSFVNPLLYLAAMGIILGSVIDERTGGVGGVSYIEFLTPGLLAATAMQAAAGDSSWSVLAGIKWQKYYVGGTRHSPHEPRPGHRTSRLGGNTSRPCFDHLRAGGGSSWRHNVGGWIAINRTPPF